MHMSRVALMVNSHRLVSNCRKGRMSHCLRAGEFGFLFPPANRKASSGSSPGLKDVGDHARYGPEANPWVFFPERALLLQWERPFQMPPAYAFHCVAKMVSVIRRPFLLFLFCWCLELFQWHFPFCLQNRFSLGLPHEDAFLWTQTWGMGEQ